MTAREGRRGAPRPGRAADPSGGPRRVPLVRVAWMAGAAVVCFFSTAPATWFLAAVPRDTWSFLEMAGHVLEFGVLAALLYLDLAQSRPRPWALMAAGLAAVCFGLVVELAQWPIPYRSFDARDLAADAGGIAAALLFVSWLASERSIGRASRR